MPTRQFTILLKYENDRAEKAEKALREAELAYQQNLTRLQSVSDYRLEYMKRLSERSLQGIDSATYSHFHAFIKKLDNASEQVEIAIKQAKALTEQKKQQWLLQRQKVQAVELLLNKKIQQLQIKANKQEQRMFDEISTQQFLRKKRAY